MLVLSIVSITTIVSCTHDTYATASTLSLSIDSTTVGLDISSISSTGTFAKSSNSTITASTTNATGYTLSIAGTGSNYDKLINGDASLSSIDNVTTEAQFKALEGTAYNKMWGYLPSKHNSEANTDFLPAPSTSGDIIDKTDSANTTANEYTIAIGARVDSTTKIGSYSNVFLVQAVANPITYSIIYDDTTVTSMPADVNTGIAMTETVNVSSNTPVRSGYTFIGWCTTTPTKNSNGIDTCPSPATQYSAGDPLTLNQQSTSNSFHLYAMWSGDYIIEGLTYLQDFAYMSTEKKGKIALSMDPTRSYTLRDSRDNQEYTIARLADGNVWMTKNLNIAGGTTLTCEKTDCDGGYVLPSDQGWQSTAGELPASSITGFDTNNYAYVYNSGNTTNCGASGQNTPCFSYYSWDVATLGSGRSIATENADAPYSICPKGWRLPTSGQYNGTTALTNWKRGDFYRLLTAYGVNLESSHSQVTEIFYKNAGAGTVANFLLSGNYYNSMLNESGVSGTYWSSASSDLSMARILLFEAYYANSANGRERKSGFSVRCLLR